MAAARRRVVLKVSGEALSGDGGTPISREAAGRLAEEIKAAVDSGTEVGVVLGGGNTLPGATVAPGGSERLTADFMGMLATVLNGLALRSALRAAGQDAAVMSAIPTGRAAELYDHERADQYLTAG